MQGVEECKLCRLKVAYKLCRLRHIQVSLIQMVRYGLTVQGQPHNLYTFLMYKKIILSYRLAARNKKFLFVAVKMIL